MTVSPTDKHPTADLSITDGTNVLDLRLCRRSPVGGKIAYENTAWNIANSPKTALRITNGGGAYDDLELPFCTDVQQDFSGGRANKVFDKDKTRFADGLRCDVLRGAVRCGPKATTGTAYVSTLTIATAPNTGTAQGSLFNNLGGVYASYTPSTNISLRSISVELSTISQASVINVSVYSDSGNQPNANIASGSIYVANSLNTSSVTYSVPIVATLTSGVKYWINILPWNYMDDGVVVPYSCDYKYGPSSGNKIVNRTPGGYVDAYTNSTIKMTLNAAGLHGTFLPFVYKGMTMGVTAPEDGTAPKIFVNGYHGLATSNAADKTKLNTAGLTGVATNALVGKIVKIVEGTGTREAQSWRVITANSDVAGKCVMTVSPAWNITHDATTMFYVLGCDNWETITPATKAPTVAPPSKPLVVNDAIYVPQTENAKVVRITYAGGAWTGYEDPTAACDFMALVQDAEGKQKIWTANSSLSAVYSGEKPATWNGAITWAGPVVCGDTSRRITGMIGAKLDGAMLPVVFKEDGFGSVNGTIFDWCRQFSEVADDHNGRCALVSGPYLWFSLQEGFERYINTGNIGQLDDKGPNRDEGLPAGRRGKIAAAVEFGSRIYAAVDAGAYGTSCVMVYNEVGWSEVYRAEYGRRIRALAVQVIPGTDTPDRLWIADGEDIVWVPVALNPEQQTGYTYYSGAQIETARIYAQFRDIVKCWRKVALFTEHVSGVIATSGTYIQVDYSVDGGAYVTLGAATTDNQEIEIKTLAGADVTGRYIQFRLTFYTLSDTTVTPVLESLRVDSIVRVPVKSVTPFTVALSDRDFDRNDIPITQSVKTRYDILKGWQNSTTTPQRLTLNFTHDLLNSLKGYIDSGSVTPVEFIKTPNEDRLAVIVGFNFVEVG